jgi:DNA-binding NtrC family response regulator
VLVVEDDPALRRVAGRILGRAGYRVLVAPSGTDALTICTNAAEHVDVLLSDVVMPEMLGPELVEKARLVRPELRVLFMSGYVHQVAAQHELPGDAELLEKPFTADALLRRVREALDAPREQAASADD